MRRGGPRRLDLSAPHTGTGLAVQRAASDDLPAPRTGAGASGRACGRCWIAGPRRSLRGDTGGGVEIRTAPPHPFSRDPSGG